MRTLRASLLLLLALALAGNATAAPLAPVSVDGQAKAAAAHLATVDEKDRPYIRYLSFYAVPDAKLNDTRRLFFFWIHQLSFKAGVQLPLAVKDGDGFLYYFDLRGYAWNAAAFSAVARREGRFVEPDVNPTTANYLRDAIGIKQDKKTLHVEAVIRADWLMRETLESLRSPSYYDLLFARQRFQGGGKEKEVVEWRKEKRIIQHEGGDYVYPDDSGRVVRNLKAGPYEGEFEYKVIKKVPADAAKFVDFPANKTDWDEAFGITDTRAFLKKQDLRTQFGAIVSGMTEDARNGSIVARHNRLLEFFPTPLGMSLQSFDVKKATGTKDYIEQAPDLARGKITFDAQELLGPLPNGGQAAMLTNGEGKRVEFADPEIAVGPEKTFPAVKNPGDCFICHAPSNGIIPPRNLVKDILDAGVDVKIKDREKYQDFLAFYVGWERKLKGYQEPYLALIEATTLEDPCDAKSKFWTGAEIAKQIAAFKLWYDGPVDPTQAARELGVPVAIVKAIAVQLPKARANMLVRGIACPRPAFDEDVYRILADVMAADRDKLPK